MQNKIELLSPARDTSIARSAILSGADAIYIGGDRFGARSKAGNSMSEIEQLVEFAHGFGVRVYMTMNTILFDNELKSARQQAIDASNAGVDALIVQDMAYMEMGLDIELHASTQMFNFTPEKVRLLEDMGFARVVLERGLSLNEIKQIRGVGSVELEAFIHGAICVGYSGQCYLSQAVTGRSGNRGECAQLCRSGYDLKRKNGEVLAKNETLLSVGDLCMGERVKDLVDAGVCSLKIEGRLKNESYVVNNTSYYNKILKNLAVKRSSFGDAVARFDPNPKKSFLRVSTMYFFDDKRNSVAAPTKSLGELIGTVQRIEKNCMILKNNPTINNGDGICWFENNENNQIEGTNVNRVEGNKIFAREVGKLKMGQNVYRNQDVKFEVDRKDVDRKIKIQIKIGNCVEAIDSEGVKAVVEMPNVFEVAKNRETAINNLKKGFAKSGDTIFKVDNVAVLCEQIPFVSMSEVNTLRREILDKLFENRVKKYKRRGLSGADKKVEITGDLDYLANVANDWAAEFYIKRGVTAIEQPLELMQNYDDKILLRSRYCIRREKKMCPKENPSERDGKQNDRDISAQTLYLQNNERCYKVDFECDRCEMVIRLAKG